MTAVVSGGTKGIGKSICSVFLENHLDISLCARNIEDLKTFKGDNTHRYPNQKIHISRVDVSKSEQVKKYADDIKREFESVDILVNNAGVFLPGLVINEDEGNLEMQINTNLFSAYHLSRALVNGMIERKKGHIFNICSVASLMAYPNGGSYSISKFALLGLSKALREELKDHNVKVTSVMPGATWSDSWKGVNYPQSRLMEADDIAKMIWSAYCLGDSAVVEEIVMRPQLGDL